MLPDETLGFHNDRQFKEWYQRALRESVEGILPDYQKQIAYDEQIRRNSGLVVHRMSENGTLIWSEEGHVLIPVWAMFETEEAVESVFEGRTSVFFRCFLLTPKGGDRTTGIAIFECSDMDIRPLAPFVVAPYEREPISIARTFLSWHTMSSEEFKEHAYRKFTHLGVPTFGVNAVIDRIVFGESAE